MRDHYGGPCARFFVPGDYWLFNFMGNDYYLHHHKVKGSQVYDMGDDDDLYTMERHIVRNVTGDHMRY